MNGVQTARARPAGGSLALAVAAWMRWQTGRDDAGRAFTVDEPLAAVTAARIAGIPDPVGQAHALLSVEAVFPPRLAGDTLFRAAVTRLCTQLPPRAPALAPVPSSILVDSATTRDEDGQRLALAHGPFEQRSLKRRGVSTTRLCG